MNKLNTVQKYFIIIFILCIFLNTFLLYEFLMSIVPNANIFLFVFLLSCLTIVVSHLTTMFIMYFIIKKIYDGDITKFSKEINNNKILNKTENKIIDIEIIEISDPIGKWMNEEIYEWIIVKGNYGKNLKFVFDGTTFDKNVKLSLEQIFIEPGIIYKLEKENESSRI